MSPFILLLVLSSTVLHATWNLIAHTQRTDHSFFLRTSMLIGLVGIGPVLFGELTGPAHFPALVWAMLVVTGIFQGLYFLGLTKGYSSGDFTVVYPVARALPVLMLAGVDVARGRIPSAAGWIGMLLVSLGCLLSPLISLNDIHWRHYANSTGFWILVTALGGVGYATIDKVAAEMLPRGALSAIHYGLVEELSAAIFLWMLLRLNGVRIHPLRGYTRARWRMASGVAIMIFTAYALILWAYQLSPFASYIVALRQFSIVIGVVTAVWLFHEPAPRLRITAALLITAGVLAIATRG